MQKCICRLKEEKTDMKNLGFGMMRLPVLSGPTDFDYDQLNRMVDTFIAAGYTYFDTSYVYHNGKSQEAARKALVERHPRNAYTIATKFPTFLNIPEDKIESVFESQLKNVGVDYFDYYLLHNIQTVNYDGIDGKGGIVKSTHLFEHALKWKEEGRIKNFGFSFHSSADLLDRVLTEHPEVDFVQIAVNPIDWDSELVQAHACYDVIRKHGKKVVIMEALKGGALAKLPEDAEKLLKSIHPDQSIASWSLRFDMGLEDVIAVLSGMSTLEQVEDNIKTANAAEPLTKEEEDALWKAMNIYRHSGTISPEEIEKYRGLTWNNIPVTTIMQTASILPIQPDPGFADDNNYFPNVLAEKAHLDIHKDLPKQKVILPDGTDATDKVNAAVSILKKYAF